MKCMQLVCVFVYIYKCARLAVNGVNEMCVTNYIVYMDRAHHLCIWLLKEMYTMDIRLN